MALELHEREGGSPDTGAPDLTPNVSIPAHHSHPSPPTLGDLPGPPVQRTAQSGQGPVSTVTCAWVWSPEDRSF